MFLTAMAVALALDALIGWPAWLYARIGHPVTWIGALIATADRRLNRGRRAEGVVVTLGILALTAGVGAALQWLHPVLTGILAWPLIAARSLHDHVKAVRAPLAAGDTDGARHAVSMIVGRDPAQLDPPAIARAATESLAENASDGVIAPLFWGVLFGLPGILAYKALNTMDSMIGHRTPRHQAFGWAAARLDDVANLLPARLTGFLFIAASCRWRAVKGMVADAPRHRSPNAGWPESAMAHILGVRLSGPRSYAGRQTDDPWLNAGAPDPVAADLGAALRLYRRAIWITGIILIIAGIA